MADPETSAADFLPESHSLTALRGAAESCRGCDLYKRATQTVFGEGPARSRVVFVGEVPGDYEDRQGHPFVGPAGRLLDKALDEIELDRNDVYVTNAVKHFKWEQVGKRRKHQKPLPAEIRACRPWLEAELAAIQPEVVVCLGKTAAESVLERAVYVRREQGSFVGNINGAAVFVTVHPSSILRAPEPEDQEREYQQFVADLRKVGRRLRG